MADRTLPTATFSFMNFSGWQRRATWCFYPNPRGSTSYGQEFGNVIQYRYPGDDYKDLMAGVDEVIKRGYIDDKKLGVTGGSGGGLLTNWVVGQTGPLCCSRRAARHRQLGKLVVFGRLHALPAELVSERRHSKIPDEYRARSPISYITNVKTPMMFILGEADYRTPPGAGGEQMFRALKFRKIPTVMVRFPNESHELSRSGQPWHRVERLQHIVGWFDHWLMGVHQSRNMRWLRRKKCRSSGLRSAETNLSDSLPARPSTLIRC